MTPISWLAGNQAHWHSPRMPEISRFYGIVIGMFYDEHRPPHFHVRYGEHQAVIRINDLVLSEGSCHTGLWAS